MGDEDGKGDDEGSGEEGADSDSCLADSAYDVARLLVESTD